VVELACERHQERQARSAVGGNATATRGSASEHRTVRAAGNATSSRAAQRSPCLPPLPSWHVTCLTSAQEPAYEARHTGVKRPGFDGV
jgi:hypothetical protein